MKWIILAVGIYVVMVIIGSFGGSKGGRKKSGGSKGSSRRGTRKITSFEDSYALIRSLKPTAWSKAEDMTPTQRARCFFIPDIEDVALITIAHKYMFDFSLQDISERRCEFGLKIGTHEYAESFDSSAGFYTWLADCTYHKLHEGSLYRQSEFELYAKRFKKSFCPPATMIKVHDLYMPESLRYD